MKPSLASVAAAAALLGAISRPATAQVLGIPVYNSGVPTGFGVAADVGFPNDDAGSGTAFGARGMLGLGPIGFTASIALHNPDGSGDNVTSVGATANLKVFGGPLIPLSVTLQGGLGYWEEEEALNQNETYLHVPIGVGIALSVPSPAVSIKPWFAPRLDINRTDTDLLDAETETDFGFSAGVELNFLSGFGLHAAYDWVSFDGAKPAILGLGAHYGFRLP